MKNSSSLLQMHTFGYHIVLGVATMNIFVSETNDDNIMLKNRPILAILF